MIKSYEQFKSKIFNNKDQLRDMLNILYNVDKLRPMVIDAYTKLILCADGAVSQRVATAPSRCLIGWCVCALCV